jgi:hypothetical protein
VQQPLLQSLILLDDLDRSTAVGLHLFNLILRVGSVRSTRAASQIYLPGASIMALFPSGDLAGLAVLFRIFGLLFRLHGQ